MHAPGQEELLAALRGACVKVTGAGAAFTATEGAGGGPVSFTMLMLYGFASATPPTPLPVPVGRPNSDAGSSPASLVKLAEALPSPDSCVWGAPHAVAVPMPALYEEAAQASNGLHATTASFDNIFAYNLTEAVTIPRNDSALA